jgi:hypothetical protein
VGYSSLRMGLLDALREIGGPEALAVSVGALQTTADPAEIAVLARNLEATAPGQYREEALNAVRETLAQAVKGELDKRDVAPLFQLLQTYGDASVIPDLEQAQSRWNYYATMALAALPDGQGIPSLLRVVQDPGTAQSGKATFAYEMLAQMAAQYPEASTALVDLARQNQISERAWQKIAVGLSGDQYQFQRSLSEITAAITPQPGLKTYHIESGNQNFYSMPVSAVLGQDQLNQRSALIQQLLSVTTNPGAVQALQNAQAILAAGIARKP